MPLAIVLTGLLLAATPGVAGAEPWLRPARGEVVASFTASSADPYGAGRRRGIVLAAGPHARVRSACSGRVAFAGPVGLAGPTVSVQCGALRATYQGLAVLDVAEGAVVAPGTPLGRLDAAGRLRFGARVARGHYRDPMTLFGPHRRPLGPAPRGPVARRPRPPAPGPIPRPVAVPVARPAAPARPAPLAAWLGLALLAAGLPLGGLAHWAAWRAHRRRRALSGTGRPARAQ